MMEKSSVPAGDGTRRRPSPRSFPMGEPDRPGVHTKEALLDRYRTVSAPRRIGFNFPGHINTEAAVPGFAYGLRDRSGLIAGVHVLIIHRGFLAVGDVEGVSSLGPGGQIALK